MLPLDLVQFETHQAAVQSVLKHFGQVEFTDSVAQQVEFTDSVAQQVEFTDSVVQQVEFTDSVAQQVEFTDSVAQRQSPIADPVIVLDNF